MMRKVCLGEYCGWCFCDVPAGQSVVNGFDIKGCGVGFGRILGRGGLDFSCFLHLSRLVFEIINNDITDARVLSLCDARFPHLKGRFGIHKTTFDVRIDYRSLMIWHGMRIFLTSGI